MTKSELIYALAQEFQLTRNSAQLIVEEVFSIITETLAHQEKTEIRGFGAFLPKLFKERTTRNPQSGQLIHIKERCSVAFRAGKTLREKINDTRSTHSVENVEPPAFRSQRPKRSIRTKQKA